MNNDLQLTSAQAGDYWTAGQTAMATPITQPSNTPPARSPMKKAHRLLRGRYPLAIVLATAGAVVGAGVGFSALKPKYESDARIRIDPHVITTGTIDPTMSMYAAVMASQSDILASARVVQQAMDSKEFKDAWAHGYGGPLPTVADFTAAIDAEHMKQTDMIKVAFTDRLQHVAEAGAHSVVAAYMALYGNHESADTRRKLDVLTAKQTELNYQLQAKRAELAKLSEKYGTDDLTIQNNAAQSELASLQTELTTAKIGYAAALAAFNQKAPAINGSHELMVQQIAAVDDTMRQELLVRERDQLALQDTAQRYGQRHPEYLAAQSRISNDTQMIDNHARDFLIQHNNRIPVAVDDQSNPYNLDTMKVKVDNLQKQVDNEKTEAFAVGMTRSKIDGIHNEITEIQENLHQILGRIDALNTQQQLAQNVSVVSAGDEAVLASDKRKLAAAAGFLFGAGLPVALLMAFGMFDDRFNYSDDAGEADLGGVTLLGILPNLPDRLSDPQQAGIAAHCVHQIRTMLQINRSNDEPQVLAVTSAAPADGKTSLTLALGLSYAACGARTLLIDCDLVAAGLTHRLNVSSTEGVLEAVANRALLEFVRTTDIADVAILPVGTTHAHHASTLSPVSLRRLLSEAKKHFDIVLVDTGPILGSIEASLVCAAADRTILTVARGQQRPLVERSIGHLQAIGARLAGVVFNRAQARDFERSMSGLALRSRPMTAVATGNDAGTFKRTA